jgi:pimeloyl-ACP methyl ester carboxylesterase
MKTEINGVQIAFTDQGTGVPILFVHGFPLNRAIWESQVESLSSSFRIITVDLRGHGESDAPLWRYSMEMFADDLAALMDHLAIKQAVMTGLSMGGYVLFAFYRKYRERVRGLILADTRASSDTPKVREGRFQMAQTAHREGIGPVADAMIPHLLSPQTIRNRPEQAEKVREIILQNSPAGIAGDLMAMAERPDSTLLLSELKCPVMVMVGKEDVSTSPQEVGEMAGKIPGGRLEIIANAGHLSNFENPDEFNRVVKNFAGSLTD